MKSLFLTFLIIFLTNLTGNAQCNVKKVNRPDGTIVKYLNPEFVGSGTGCELGLSVSFNGTEYFINTTVRYYSTSTKQIGTLKIQFQNDESLALNLHTSELATMQGESISLGVYYTTSSDIQKLKSFPLKRVVFTENNGLIQIISINQNKDVMIRHIKCLSN